MYDLEELKSQMQHDSQIIKELEEYVADIAFEYFNKEDFRKTKLFREIEQIFLAFPENELIAEEYVSCFSSLDGIEKGKKGKKACEMVEKIYHQYPNNREIAINLTYLLMMRSYELDSNDCNKVILCIQKICEHFPDESEIKEHLEEVNNVYQNKIEYEKLGLHAKILSEKVAQNPDSTDLILEYIETLGMYAPYTDEDQCRHIRAIVINYYNRLSENLNYKRNLLKIDTALIENTTGKETVILFKEIQHIYKENPLLELAVLYAEALCTFLGVKESYYKSAIQEIKTLYEIYPNSSEIAASYACILFMGVDIHDENERIAKKILLELFELAKKHLQNIDIQEYLEDAKNSFAFDHQEAIFWKSSDTKKVNKNCFAVLDTETTWDNKVMTIGIVIADKKTYKPEVFKYYVLHPEFEEGGLYGAVASLPNNDITTEGTREEILYDLQQCLKKHNVTTIYAYNMSFDKSKLPELDNYSWYDIMGIAANKNYNKFISEDMECFKSGRLKRGYSAESIIQLLSGKNDYTESHNALFDAMDELKIMQYLRLSLDSYHQSAIPLENKECIQREKFDNNVFNVGDRIFHKSFGHGLILNCSSETFGNTDSYSATVSFIGKECKNMLVPFPQFIKKEL